MADILQTAAVALAAVLKTQVGQSVTYTRGASSVTATATLGRKLLRFEDEIDGVRVERTEQDFIFTTADLKFGPTQIVPQRGDTITLGAKIFTVSAEGADPEWQWGDQYQTMIRVHAKQRS